MNIVIFTQEDPFYVKTFFDEFLRRYRPLTDIRAVVISRAMGKKSPIALARQMLAFYGAVDFIKMGVRYAGCKAMSRTRIKVKDSRGVHRTYGIGQLAESYGLNVIRQDDLNNMMFLGDLQRLDPDLFISVASPVIFGDELISIPRLDCINIHNAPLPKYRGMLPNFWQLYHGEAKAGITIHRINRAIDRGDIVLQKYVPIEPHETLHDLIIKTKREGAGLMIKVIEDFRKGSVTYRKMEGEGTYFTFPRRSDVQEFKKRGKRLF